MQLGINHTIRWITTISLGLCLTVSLHAGGFGGGFGQAVGGVMIDTNGVLRTATTVERADFANFLRNRVDAPQGDLLKPAKMRMVSVKGLTAAVAKSRQAGEPLPESVAFMAGLQRIEYVFVDQENNDIVLAGPAEPWKLRADGTVVGTVSGGAVLMLEDLVAAFRTVETARHEGMSCSIEPTADGRRRLQKLLQNVKLRPGQNPAVFEESMKQAFGPQMVKLTGVIPESRFARTLVAADYEMKRIAMDLAESNVDGLPSYLDMSKNSRHGAGQNPRWWMACNYDALAKSEDELAWKISGQGVKTMTEQDVVAKDGSVEKGGRTDKVAQKWAEAMTQKFTALSQKMPIFRDLRNAMDMAVVATLIAQHRLDQKAGVDLAELTSPEAFEMVKYTAPKSLDPQCSFVKGRSGWVVTASGGVDVSAFKVVQNQETQAGLADTRIAALKPHADRWWWNQ